MDGVDPTPVFHNQAKVDAVQKVQEAFQDYSMQIMDWSDDLNHVIVRTTGLEDSGTWFRVDVRNLQARAFTYERMAIEHPNMSAISQHSNMSRPMGWRWRWRWMVS